jgi:hypothetical protein
MRLRGSAVHRMTAHDDQNPWTERINQKTAALAASLEKDPVTTTAQLLLVSAGIVRALGPTEGAAFLDVAATDLLEYENERKKNAPAH